MLGHDLRAAISDIIGGLRLIDPAPLEPATRAQLERVRAASEGMARLMEEALALLLGDAGPEVEAAADPTALNLPRLLREAEMRWSGRAREKGLGFGLCLGARVPQMVTVERIALERILSNLLSNAIKYTDAGAVQLSVDCEAEGTLILRVSDAGPGFSNEALERLFQAEGRPGGAAKPGSGLGLHIAKQMADRLGGRIEVKNLPAGGADVVLHLPRDRWQPAAARPEAADLYDLSALRVLVAEDSPTNQQLIGRMLARLGAEYEIAADGVEALDLLDRACFDLALIDIEMPRLSGIEVIRALRARPDPMASIPVVAVTAYVLRANREAIYASGADAILAKPLGTLDTFADALRLVLDPGRADRPIDAKQADNPDGVEMDIDRFHHLLDIAGPEGAVELVTRLLADLRAIERAMVGALSGPDLAELRAQTHVLIALSGAVGADRLMHLSRQLNAALHRRGDVALDHMTPDVLRLLDDLIHFIAQKTPPEDPPTR